MRIALIHAVRVAMQPVEDAFARHWPQAERVNLLDDSLSPDPERDGELTAAMSRRIELLAEYALSAGAAGILYTCSAFGDAIQGVKQRARVPVLKPNEAMFDEALARGTRIGMLATFPPSVPSMEAEFGKPMKTLCVPEAMAALKPATALRTTAGSPRRPRAWKAAMRLCSRTSPPRARETRWRRRCACRC